MKKLSREFIINRDASVKDLSGARDNVTTAVYAYNEWVAKHAEEYAELVERIQGAVNDYNAVLSELSLMNEETASEAREHYEARSEKWQDGDAGRAYSNWVEQLEAVSFGEEIDELDLPELVEIEVPDMPSPDEDVELPDDAPEPV